MADIKAANLRNVVAGMMERQAEATKAKPTGVLGSLWEKATGEIELYNKALEEHARLKTKQKRTLLEMQKAQSKLDKIQREVREGVVKGTKEKKKAAEQTEKLREEIEKLHDSNEELAESVNNSTQKMEGMNKGGGIFRNGMTVLAARVGAAAAAFGGFNQALTSVEKRLQLASMTVGDFGALHIAPTMDKTESYIGVLKRVAGVAYDWHGAMVASSKELMKLGINVEEAHKITGTYATGLRLATENEAELITRTEEMTKKTGFLATMLRVDTEALANATVDASKRFGKGTGEMADDLASLYYTFQGIRKTSKDVVLNFGDLTRATLEAQSSFQGYNFNARATANIMGNVVAKAQELSTTYEMAMQGAKGLAGVLTGGKAPDWAKYIAGRDLLRATRQAVAKVKKEGVGDEIRDKLAAQFTIPPDKMKELSDSAVALAAQFGFDPTTEAGQKQIQGLENLSKNYRKYGPLSSAKMTEEILRGTEGGTKMMYKMIKKHADAPEGREMLMRIWGLDEAAATAAVLSLQSVENLKDLAKLRDEAQDATRLRKPPTAADLEKQTKAFAEAVGQAKAGISGMIKNVWDWMKENPVVGAGVGTAGAASSAILPILQSGIGQALGNAMGGTAVGRILSKTMGGVGKVAGAAATPFKWMGRGIGQAAGGISRGAGAAAGGISRGAGAAGGKIFGRTAAATSARSGAMVMESVPGLFGKMMSGLKSAASGLKNILGNAAGTIAKAAKSIGPALGRVAGGVGTALGGVGRAAAGAWGGLKRVTQTAGPLGKAGLVGMAAGVGLAAGSLLRLIPGVDSFTEGLINSTAKLLGFSHATEGAEDAENALANKSKGITDALDIVSKGIVDDYEKDSFNRTKAVVMLKGMQDEDLKAHAKKVAATGKLTEEEALSRLQKLRDEKIDHDKWRKQREAAKKEGLQAPTVPVPVATPGGKAVAGGALAPKAVTPPITTAAPGAPTAVPAPARGRRRGGRAPVGRQPEANVTSARVDPDTSIALTLTIPGNVLAKQSAQAAGHSE